MPLTQSVETLIKAVSLLALLALAAVATHVVMRGTPFSLFAVTLGVPWVIAVFIFVFAGLKWWQEWLSKKLEKKH